MDNDQLRTTLLEDLSHVAAGGIAESDLARDPKRLARMHLPVREHERALDPDVLLVLGGRGVGKSQLFRALTRLAGGGLVPDASGGSRRPRTYVVGFETEGTAFPSTTVLSQVLGDQPGARLRLLWIGLLTGALLRADRAWSRDLGERLPRDLAALLRESLASPSQWLLKVGEHLEGVDNGLDQLNAALVQRDEAVCVAYDDLDVLAGEVAAIHELARELLAFWLVQSRRWTHLRCKVFLRTDIFNAEVLSFPDSSKLRPRSVTLSWTGNSLFRLLLKRLANGEQSLEWGRYWEALLPGDCWRSVEPWGVVPATDEASHQRFIGSVIGQYMGSDPRRGLSHPWVTNHLQDTRRMVVPRSFLNLFEAAAKRQLEEGLPRAGGRLLEPTEIQAALQEVSELRIQELAEEYPWVNDLKQVLEANTVPMGRTAFLGLIGKVSWSSPPIHADPKQIAQDLLDLAILRQTSDGRIHVPDIYLYGFRLKRKGGIRRPKA